MKTPDGHDRPAEFFIALDLPIPSRAVRHAAADLLVGEGRSVAEHDRCQPGKRHHEQSQRTAAARNHQGPLCLKKTRSNRSNRPKSMMRARLCPASMFTARASRQWLKPQLGAKHLPRISPSSMPIRPRGNASLSNDLTTPTKLSTDYALVVNPTTNRSSPTSTTSSANLNSRSTDSLESNPNRANSRLASMHFNFHGRTADSLRGLAAPRLPQRMSNNCAQSSRPPTHPRCGVVVHPSRFRPAKRLLRSKQTPAMFSAGCSHSPLIRLKMKLVRQRVGCPSLLRGQCHLLPAAR